MMEGLIRRKPGDPSEALAHDAKAGLDALSTLLRDRDNALKEVNAQRQVIEKLTMENEGLRESNLELQRQRDFWMRTNARVEALLANLWAVMNSIGVELNNAQQHQTADANVQQIAQRFAPEVTNGESVG